MERLKSRKLWITVITAAIIAFGDEFGIELDMEELIALGGIVLAYLGVQGTADVKEAAKPAPPAALTILSAAKAEYAELNAATSVH